MISRGEQLESRKDPVAIMNVAELILSTGADADVAIIHGQTTMSYGALRERVQRVASALLGRGLSVGDSVGLWAENGTFFVTAYLAIVRAGLVVVPLPPDLSAAGLQRIITQSRMKGIFVSKRYANRLRAWTESSNVPLFSEDELAADSLSQTSDLGRVQEGDLAALMFTSGSTGIPKGVMVSHRNIACNTRDIVSYLGLTSSDRIMAVLPFHYCYGASLLHTHLAVGGTVVINNEFTFPEAVLQDMLARECTGFAGVPSTYQILLRKSRFTEIKFPALRWLQQAGGKLPNAYIEQIRQSFPHLRYFTMYGQTEATARLSYLPPEYLATKLGSIGKGLTSTRLEVLKPDGQPVQPGSDEIGEIVASGDNITSGYWEDPEETARYFKNGKLHTGDLARVDADGFIYVVEREREFIKSGGKRVSAKEVEDVIAEIPEIIEVAVVGMPHDVLGEGIRACLVARDRKLMLVDVANFCKKRLPAFKVPQRIDLIKAMPHNTSGKVMKGKLKELTEQDILESFLSEALS
jgi:long-chain acyl-CoA synthetase